MKGSAVGDSSRKFLDSQEIPHCFDVKLVSMSLGCFLPFFTGEIFCWSVEGSISVYVFSSYFSARITVWPHIGDGTLPEKVRLIFVYTVHSRFSDTFGLSENCH